MCVRACVHGCPCVSVSVGHRTETMEKKKRTGGNPFGLSVSWTGILFSFTAVYHWPWHSNVEDVFFISFAQLGWVQLCAASWADATAETPFPEIPVHLIKPGLASAPI